jgi:hypothetical protein
LLLSLAFAGLKSASAQSRYLAGCLAMLLMGLAPLITIRYEIQSAKPASLAAFLQPIEKTPDLNDKSPGSSASWRGYQHQWQSHPCG